MNLYASAVSHTAQNIIVCCILRIINFALNSCQDGYKTVYTVTPAVTFMVSTTIQFAAVHKNVTEVF